MMRSLQIAVLAASLPVRAQLVDVVKAQISRGDFGGAQSLLADFKNRRGATPEMLEAHSWLGRGALAARRLDQAEAFALETYKMCEQALAKRALDAEPRLPIALGAAIEVHGQVLAQHGQRGDAVSYLNGQLKRYYATSIRARLQKNLHLLTLEGKPAPPLQMKQFVTSAKMTSVESLRGKTTLLFFWAHWCSDCKNQAPIIERLRKEFPALHVLAPTQPYGYVAGGQEAHRTEEIPYIRKVFDDYFAGTAPVAVPISEENFRAYGVSSTPTLALLDKQGVVRLYHPGAMSYEDLRAAIQRVVN